MERKNALMVFTLASILIVSLISPSFTFEPAFASDVLWAIEKELTLPQETVDIHKISPIDGSIISSATVIYSDDITEAATGLAADPTTGTFYALLKVEDSDTRLLVTIVPSTGMTTLVGETGEQFAGLAFLADGTLLGVTGDQRMNPPPDAESLFTINKITGASTFVCALGNGDDGETIAFNPSTGLVGHLSGFDNNIFETIDDDTVDPCDTTDIPLSGDSIEDEATGMTYSTAEGLFLFTSNADTGTPGFYSLTDSGVVDFRGPTLDVDGDEIVYKGLAFNVHDDILVGGTFIPIDQSALLLAGVQSISMWMIPVVIAGIGIGVFVIKRRN